MTKLGEFIWNIFSLSRFLIIILLLQAGPAKTESITIHRENELINMIRHDCGSCHGITLRGGLGPPLTADALAGKNHGLIYNTIVFGRENTAMPPWEGLLNEDEIEWIVNRLQEGVDTWRQE